MTNKAYIYQADIYCEDCGKAIRKRLNNEGKAPESPSRPHTYGSDDYPKGPFDDGGGEADSPQHCGNGPECLNAVEVTSLINAPTLLIGMPLENPLTADGLEYVRKALAQNGPTGTAKEIWADIYSDELEN